MKTVNFEGNPVSLMGEFPQVGEMAPLFTLCGNDLEDITLDDFAGMTVILNIFPSLDTPLCAISVKEFNKLVGNNNNIEVINVSADLPFAYTRFANEHRINAEHGSFFRNDHFTSAYGVAITDGPLRGLAARAVVVIDENGRVIYSELVEEITKEVDYIAAMDALN